MCITNRRTPEQPSHLNPLPPLFGGAGDLTVVAPGGGIKKAQRTDEQPLFLQLYFWLMPPLEGVGEGGRGITKAVTNNPPFLAALFLAAAAPGGGIKKERRTNEHPLFSQSILLADAAPVGGGGGA